MPVAALRDRYERPNPTSQIALRNQVDSAEALLTTRHFNLFDAGAEEWTPVRASDSVA